MIRFALSRPKHEGRWKVWNLKATIGGRLPSYGPKVGYITKEEGKAGYVGWQSLCNGANARGRYLADVRRELESQIRSAFADEGGESR